MEDISFLVPEVMSMEDTGFLDPEVNTVFWNL